MKETTWIERWNDTIASEPELPGVFRRKAGGYRIRARATDPRTSKLREVNRVVDCKRAREALVQLETELEKIRSGIGSLAARAIPTFAEWAVTVLERKIANQRIISASGRAKWDWALRVHLIPAFGDVFVDRLTRDDIEAWKQRELLSGHEHTKDDKRERVLKGERYKPNTINSLLAILRQITGEASDCFNLGDPCRRVEDVSKRTHRTYTHEEPNALKPDDVPRFLDAVYRSHREHYAFVFLGFTTGLRPSSLRPLRCNGKSADVKWETGELLVRRSHTHKAEVMESTKTGVDQIIALDERQLAVLREHVALLETKNLKRAKRSPDLADAMEESELLFPARPSKRKQAGGFRSPSCLDKMFAAVGKKLKLDYEVTPRSMRRTYQDLCRAASVADIVTRSISGHATPEMQRHYSTVSAKEQRAGLAKVVDLAVERARRAA